MEGFEDTSFGEERQEESFQPASYEEQYEQTTEYAADSADFYGNDGAIDPVVEPVEEVCRCKYCGLRLSILVQHKAAPDDIIMYAHFAADGSYVRPSGFVGEAAVDLDSNPDNKLA